MTDPDSALVCIAYLYRKTSRAGNPLLFGRVGDLRLYAFETEDRRPKDCKPEIRLCILREDYDQLKDKLPKALAIKAQEHEP